MKGKSLRRLLWISSEAIVARAIVTVYLIVWTIGFWYEVDCLYKRPVYKNGNFPHNIKKGTSEQWWEICQIHSGDAINKKKKAD